MYYNTFDFFNSIAMHTTPNLPVFETLDTILSESQSPYSISQLHGLLCGYICANKSKEAHIFLQHFFSTPKITLSEVTKTEIFELLTHSEEMIQQVDFDFQLYLPEENTQLNKRTRYFADWCQSFLHGLKICNIQEYAFSDPETKELMEAFNAFSELDCEIISMSDEDEASFTEIYEYARLAVLDLHLSCKTLLGADENSVDNSQH